MDHSLGSDQSAVHFIWEGFIWAGDKIQHLVLHLVTRIDSFYLAKKKNRQFSSVWRQTREHDNWPPESFSSVLSHPVVNNVDSLS